MIKKDAYLDRYSDYSAAEKWVNENVASKQTPPIQFTVDGKNSDSLEWKKSISDVSTAIDYPDDNPKERKYYTVTYYNEEYKLELALTVTSYPEYPIVEYSSYLTYKGCCNSSEITDIYSMNSHLMFGDNEYKYHYSRGCVAGLAEFGADYSHDYNLYEKVFAKGDELTLKVENGKSTSMYLPFANAENLTANNGVISVISWQGNWTNTVSMDNEGFKYAAMLNNMDFQLYPEERIKLPTMLLLFYKGDWLNGQNIYRRWVYNHNLLRNSTKKHITTNNLYLTTGPTKEGLIDVQSDIECDLAALDNYKKSALMGKGTYYVIDAGWFDYKDGTCWFNVAGNYYYEDKKRYPNGIIELAKACNDCGLKFSLWVESERIGIGTDVYNNLKSRDFYSAYNKNIKIDPVLISEKLPNDGALLNYSEPEVVEFNVDLADAIVKRTGMEIYRQDFNTPPASFWENNDKNMEEATGIKRTGLTEIHYCEGYLNFLQGVADRNPGLMYDLCASGGMRYDMESERYGYMLTRTDMFHGFTFEDKVYTDGTVCQNITYVTSLWHVGMASYAVDQSSSYNTLSSITTYWGTGISNLGDGNIAPYAENFKYFDAASKYSIGDYYPLTEYGDQRTDTNVIFQFAAHDSKSGVVSFCARKEGTLTAKLRDIDVNAKYRYHKVCTDEYIYVDGKTLVSDGISFKLSASEAVAIEYEMIG